MPKLSTKLDNLIEFISPEEFAAREAILWKRSKELGMERQFFPGTHVPAPSEAAKKPGLKNKRFPKNWYKERSEDSRSLSVKLDKLIQFGDPRPRNPLGEFSGEQEGVPDPNTMHKTYAQTATNAAVGGAAGAVGGATAGASGVAVKKLLEIVKRRKAKI